MGLRFGSLIIIYGPAIKILDGCKIAMFKRKQVKKVVSPATRTHLCDRPIFCPWNSTVNTKILQVEDKRKRVKREGKPPVVDEDDPAKVCCKLTVLVCIFTVSQSEGGRIRSALSTSKMVFQMRHAIHILTTKIFADQERKRQNLSERANEEKLAL